MDEPTTNAADIAERQAALLSAALPYMQKYENKTVVVKYGGHVPDSDSGSYRRQDYCA